MTTRQAARPTIRPGPVPRPPLAGRGAPWILILLILAPAAIFALSPGPDPLLQADKLIQEQRYDEAIAFLVTFMKEHPERFDEAQARIKQVIAVREAYNDQSAVLIEVLVNKPEEVAQALDIITALESTERNPSPAVQAFVAESKETALFTYNAKQLDSIMARGRALIDAGRYADASKAYEEGFVLYREQFDEKGYDEFTVGAADAALESVKGAIAAFPALYDAALGSAEALKRAFASGDPALVGPALARTEAAIRAYTVNRGQAIEAGRAMQAQFEVLRKLDAKLSDAHFLPFAATFTLGRKKEAKPEGVLGAMDIPWIEWLNGIQSAAEPAADGAFAALKARFDGEDYGGAIAAAESVSSIASYAARSLALWGSIAAWDISPQLTALGRAVLKKVGDYFRLEYLGQAATAYRRLAEARLALEERSLRAETFMASFPRPEPVAVLPPEAPADSPKPPAPVPDPAPLAELASYRVAARDSQAAFEREAREALARAGLLSAKRAEGFPLEGPETIQKSVEAWIALSLARARAVETDIVALASDWELAILSRDMTAREAELARGRALYEGIVSQSLGIRQAYPTESLPVLKALETALRDLRARAAAYAAKYEGDDSFVTRDARLVAGVAEGRSIVDRADRLLAEGSTIQARAAAKRQQAETARIEAEARVVEARQALGRENFDQARDRLAKARERYTLALSLQEDPVLRATSDPVLEQLGVDIVRAENDKVIRDTRKLITDGKDFYYQGIFDRAEDSLLQARARWRTTHADEAEPEVEFWLNLIRTALSLKTGRDIPASTPLFPEMSQLLSLARGYYEKGKDLLDRGRKTEGLQYFALARQKLQEVKVVFPLNQEAAILALLIEQRVDPPVFMQAFAARVADAKDRVARAKKDRAQVSGLSEVYTDLQDLYEIEPAYAGLKALIYEVEILIGIKMPPLDPKKVQASKDLTDQAERLIASGVQSQLALAKDKLVEALGLNPDNERAQKLKDRVETLLGGQTVLGLPAAGEALFDEALAAVTAGDKLTANAKIEQLYQLYPQAKKVEKVNQLNLRIKATL